MSISVNTDHPLFAIIHVSDASLTYKNALGLIRAFEEAVHTTGMDIVINLDEVLSIDEQGLEVLIGSRDHLSPRRGLKLVSPIQLIFNDLKRYEQQKSIQCYHSLEEAIGNLH